jgi:acetyl esterase/lipase
MPIWIKFALTALAAVFVVGVVAACSPLTAINALTPSGSYRLTAGIPYGEDPRNKLDIYTPRGQAGPMPIVVFFYGGNWNTGSRADYEFVGEALASRGMVAVIADYRLYPQVRYPDFLRDGARAVAWTMKEARRYGGDPGQLFVMGHSAGAYNASMVALDRRWLAEYGMEPAMLRGWIGLAGPYDFIPIGNEDTRPVFFYPATPTDSQPINHAVSGLPPALLIASRNDRLVDPVRNTGGLAKRLRLAGVGVDEIYFDNTSHTTLVGAISRPLRALAPVLDKVEQFVRSGGKLPQPQP